MPDRFSSPQERAAGLRRRVPQLILGLVLYGVSVAIMVRANLGLNPWDVLHEGLSERSGLRFGVVSILVSVAVLLLWLPIRQRPGFGTVCNVFIVGLTADATLAILQTPPSIVMQAVWLLTGVVLNAAATAAYIGADFGPGPRDGLMTGLVRRMGWPLGATRMGIELGVLFAGWLLGGSVGVGTAVYAILIGPLVQVLLPMVATGPDPPRGCLKRASTHGATP